MKAKIDLTNSENKYEIHEDNYENYSFDEQFENNQQEVKSKEHSKNSKKETSSTRKEERKKKEKENNFMKNIKIDSLFFGLQNLYSKNEIEENSMPNINATTGRIVKVTNSKRNNKNKREEKYLKNNKFEPNSYNLNLKQENEKKAYSYGESSLSKSKISKNFYLDKIPKTFINDKCGENKTIDMLFGAKQKKLKKINKKKIENNLEKKKAKQEKNK